MQKELHTEHLYSKMVNNNIVKYIPIYLQIQNYIMYVLLSLFHLGIMCAWTVAGVSTTVFMCIYDTEDFRERLNMKIAPSLEYKLVLVFIMVANFLFCYIWEVNIHSIFPSHDIYTR